MPLWKTLLAVAAVCFSAAAAVAQPVRTDNVETELHSTRAAVAPGETFTILLRQTIRPDWHTYWINAGDSGEPTMAEWQATEGVTIGPLKWPTPAQVTFGDVVTYGYEGEVFYPIAVTAPATARPGDTLELTAQLTWLVCSDICIPEDGVVRLSTPVAAAGRDDPTWAARLPAVRAALPQDLGLQGATAIDGEAVRLTVSGDRLAALTAAGDLRDPFFFPYRGDVIVHGPPQAPDIGRDEVRFTLRKNIVAPAQGFALAGVMTAEVREGGAWVRRGFLVNGGPDGPAPAIAAMGAGGASSAGGGQSVGDGGGGVSLLAALGLAFLGGLILNVMPCVFPVLAVKGLSLASGAASGEARRHGVLFFAGVMISMLALGGLVVGLRAAGAELGWGFQLQDPWFVAGLTMLFFLLGLNLLGVFEVGGSVQNLGAGLAGRGGDLGALFTGVLAVVAATPCLAPFMSTAVAWALAQPPAASLPVFGALGVGFALPFTALAFAPGLHKALPRPGPWMERTKQAFAFLMFGTAVWLAWVLSGVGGRTALLILLAGLAALGFVIWAFGAFQGLRGRVASSAAAVVAFAAAVWLTQPTAVERRFAPEPWSAARVAALQAEGRAVFVNFTADWCVTCKINERAALSSPAVAAAFVDGDVAYLKGDWTERTKDISDELARHGQPGVPLYLFYPAGAEGARPMILPQTLSERLVIDTLGGANAAPTR